jgi:nicotinamide mononucleotide (NMN) deamidase PncC
MLAERELILGTVECGVDGIVSRRIFDTPDGPAVLGNSLVVDEVEKAINLLDLPRPQFRKAGDFSAKAARAAAREGRAFLGVDLCLAVWGSAPLDDSRPVHIALDTGEQVIDHTFQVEGQGERATDRLADRALDMVRQALS